jgi:hypothetical protein
VQTFLTADELVALTGRKRKAHQIEALRQQGIPFYVNAIGRPVVVRAALNGATAVQARPTWSPRVLASGRARPA